MELFRKLNVHRTAFFIATMTVAVFVAYFPLLNGGFIWDDNVHIPLNPLITAPNALSQIWSVQGFQQFLPIQLTSYWLEVQLWGYNTLPFHIANLILHIANGALIWSVLERLKFRWAPFAAAVFLLHPINVETAGYITERRNLFSALFYLSSLLCWLQFQENGRTRSYLSALGLFVLALLSKTVSCSLPVTFLLIGWMQGRSLSWRTIKPTIPFFVIGLPFGLLTMFMERSLIGADGYEWSFTLGQRLLIAGHALFFYFGKIAWPHPMIFIYPRWNIDTSDWSQWLWPVAAAGVIASLIPLTRKFERRPAAALLFFGITIFPAIGFSNIYPQRFSFVADHFQYVAGIGVIVFILGSIDYLTSRILLPENAKRLGLQAVGAAVLLIFCGLVFNHAHAFQSDQLMWQDILTKNDTCWLAHANRASGLYNTGHIDEAISHYEKAWQYSPHDLGVAASLGDAYGRAGRSDDARKLLEDALSTSPALEMVTRGVNPPPATIYDHIARFYKKTVAPAALRDDFLPLYQRFRVQYTVDILLLLANFDWEAGKNDSAEQHLKLARSLMPKSEKPLLARGKWLEKSGDLAGALADYQSAAELLPSSAEAFYRVGVTQAKLGHTAGAIGAWNQSLAANAHYAPALWAMSDVAWQNNQIDESERLLREGLKEMPNELMPSLRLAEILRRKGQMTEYTALLEKLRESSPNCAEIYLGLSFAYRGTRPADAIAILKRGLTMKLPEAGQFALTDELAWLLATCSQKELRNSAEAVRLAESSSQHSSAARSLDTLAAAYAENGEFDKAVAVEQKAIQAAESGGMQKLAQTATERLKLYKNGQAYHETELQLSK